MRYAKFDFDDGVQVNETAEAPFGTEDVAVVYSEDVTGADDGPKQVCGAGLQRCRSD